MISFYTNVVNQTLLLYGVGSEYVFKDFAKLIKIKYRKLNIIEVDALRVDCRKIFSKLDHDKSKKQLYFINSSHILLDNDTFRLTSGERSNYIASPLEIIKKLNPYRSVFVPHDLTTPILPKEYPYLGFFHKIWYPYHNYDTSFTFKDFGWIKYLDSNDIDQKNYQYKIIFFLSDIMWHLNYGIEKSYQKYSRLFNMPGLAVKLPTYPGSDQFEDYLRHKNINIIESSENATNVMENANLVISNGLSSTVVEAHFLGIPAILIKENFYSNIEYMDLLTKYPEIVVTSLSSLSSTFIDTILEREKPIKKIKYFETQNAINNLIGDYE